MLVLCGEEEAILGCRELGAHLRNASLVHSISVPVPLPVLRDLDWEPCGSVRREEFESNVAAASRAPRIIDTLLVTSTVLDSTLVDVLALHPRATHEFELEAGGHDVVLDEEAEVTSLDWDWEVEDGKGRLQDSELNGSPVRVRVVLEEVSQVIRVLQI
jgi:hypothetical protein